MHTIDNRSLALLQHLRGSDVCLDHKFFDEPVSIQTLGNNNAVNLAGLIEHDLALGQI